MRKTEKRTERKYSGTLKNVHFDESQYRIGLKLLRKIPGHKNKRLADIEDFYRTVDIDSKHYYVMVKGNIVAVA